MRVLLGLHDVAVMTMCSGFAQLRHYSVDSTRDPEKMLELAKTKEYDFYLMDLNLGDSGSTNVEPAKQVYAVVKERVESKKAKFLGISGSSAAVRAAKEKGLPACLNTEFKIYDFLG